MEKSHSHQMLIEQMKNGTVIQSEHILGVFCCLLCNCSISGQSQAESHVVGAQHAKKLLEKKFPPQTTSANAEPNTSQEFSCKLCALDFTGPIPLNQHLNGKTHRKNELGSLAIKQDGIAALIPNITSKSISIQPSQLPTANSGSNPSPACSTLQNTFCELCSVELTGRIPMEHHLMGKAHQKKLAMQSQPFKQETSATVANITNTPIQRTLQIANTGSNPSPDSSTSKNIFCELCFIELSGSIQFEHHLMGKAHQKKLAMKSHSIQQQERSAALPTITSTSIQTTPSSTANTGTNASNSLNQENTYCKICCVELTGTIPMEQHLKGKSHMRKLLYFPSSTTDVDPTLQEFKSSHVDVKCTALSNKRPLHDLDSTLPAEKTCRDTSPMAVVATKPKSLLTIDEHESVPDLF